MEFIHNHFLKVTVRPFSESDVAQDFGRATQNGRVSIDRGIARAQPDIFRAELAAKGEPFLIYQRFDWAGVNRAFALRQGLEVKGRRDQRFAGTGGGIEDDIFFLKKFENGCLLGRIELQAFTFGVLEEAAQQDVIRRMLVARN